MKLVQIIISIIGGLLIAGIALLLKGNPYIGGIVGMLIIGLLQMIRDGMKEAVKKEEIYNEKELNVKTERVKEFVKRYMQYVKSLKNENVSLSYLKEMSVHNSLQSNDEYIEVIKLLYNECPQQEELHPFTRFKNRLKPKDYKEFIDYYCIQNTNNDQLEEKLKQLNPQENNKQKLIVNLLRVYEDFDLWLTKKNENAEKEYHEIARDYNFRHLFHSSAYLDAQFERVKKYQNEIKEYWLRKVKRPQEDILLENNVDNIDLIEWIQPDDKDVIMNAAIKKDKVINEIEEYTIANLTKTVKYVNDIKRVQEKVLKR